MDNICRLCLGNKAILHIFNENSTIHEKLMSYCKLNISKSDGLPEYVCSGCVKKLNCVVQFINRCEESDKVLRSDSFSYVTKEDSSTVKSEPYSDGECDDTNFKDSDDDNNIPHSGDVKNTSNLLKIKKENDEYKVECNFSDLAEDNKPLIDFSNDKSSVKIKKVKSKNDFKSFSEEKLDSSNNNEVNETDIKSDSTVLFDESYADLSVSDIFVKRKRSKNRLLTIKDRKGSKKFSHSLENFNDENKKQRKLKYTDESQLCFTCGKCFPRASALKQHILKHNGVTHKCSQCPKTFSTRDLMKVHERRHGQEKNFPCHACGRTFTSGYLAKKHYMMVHERNFAVSCKLCNKGLSNPRSLAEHMKIHTGEKNYECIICQKKFAHKLSLVCHTRVHTGEQPYACRFCEKRFSILKSLKEHERLHTGEKPYGCPLCPKRFEQLGNMKSHFKYNHKGLDLKKVQLELRTAQEPGSLPAS